MPGVPPLGAGELAGGFGLLFGGTLAFTFLVGVVILLLPTVVLPRWCWQWCSRRGAAV